MFFIMMWSNGFPYHEPGIGDPLIDNSLDDITDSPSASADPWVSYRFGDIGDAWFSSRWQTFR